MKQYSIENTTKTQREKLAMEAMGICMIDAPKPTEKTLNRVQEYIDGKKEISDILQETIESYKNP